MISTRKPQKLLSIGITNFFLPIQDMFGENAVIKDKGDLLELSVNGKLVEVNLAERDVICKEDETLRDMVYTALNKLHQVLAPTH